MRSGSRCLLLLSLTQILFVLPSYAQDTITLALSKPHHSSLKSTDKDFVPKILVRSTLQRAYYLRHGKQHPSYNSYPLFPVSPGSHSFSLLLGTPPQKIPVTLDTGSSLVWVPCTSHFKCSTCTTSSSNSTITIFKPKLSSSQTHINCHSKKCKWLDQSTFNSSCTGCGQRLAARNCSKPCLYTVTYGGGGNSKGHASIDDLRFPNNNEVVVHDFFFGCSHSTDSLLPEGLAGFGRSPASLPNQLKVTKFSYCLVSHKYNDDTNKTSLLILGKSGKVPGIKYTPMLQSPPLLPYNQFYYVHVAGISINNKYIEIPAHVLAPDAKGNGGSIVDSGTALTTMNTALFNELVKEYLAHMSTALRKKVQFVASLLCVDASGKGSRVLFPEVAFHFKGGAIMDVPADNYLDLGDDILCLPFANGSSAVGGPTMIIGNYQQQNFLIEFDLKNEKLGLKKQNCG